MLFPQDKYCFLLNSMWASLHHTHMIFHALNPAKVCGVAGVIEVDNWKLLIDNIGVFLACEKGLLDPCAPERFWIKCQ